jgi:hypothetical protein
MLMGVVMAALFFISGIRRQDSVSLVMALAPALLVFLIILRLRRVGRLYPATQAEWIEWIWKNEAPHTRALEGDITDEGILMKRPTREILTRWTSITGYGEYRNMLVLAPYNDDFLLFPKRFFEREREWDEFRNRVTESMRVMYRVIESESSQRSQV